MARKDINIGLTGNDGTGDSIRDAFLKVNNNFQELYASQGLEAGLTFANLVDVVKPLRPNTILGLDNLGNNVISRDLVVNNGLTIDTASDPSKIILSLAGIQISLDPNPTLSNILDASGFRVTSVGDPTSDQDAVSRKWVYQNFLNRDNIDLLSSVQNANGSTMRQNFKIAPFPDNGNTNVGDQFITVKGSDGISTSDILLKYQAVDPSHATRKDYVDTKLSLQGTLTKDPATGQINQGFGIMTGPLVLNDHPTPYTTILRKPNGTLFTQPDYRAATKGYVDSKTYSSPNNIYVSTAGNDAMWDFENDRPNPVYGYPEAEIGRSWSKAFASLNVAAKFATKYMERVLLQNTPYQVSPTAIVRWVPPFTNAITSPRTRVRISIQNHGFVDGDYVQVSGAILGSSDTRNLNGIFRVNKIDANIFELNLKSLVTWPNPEVAPNGSISIALANKKDGPYSTLSRVENGFRGFFVPKPEITIMIESGVYYEELPIRVPANCAIKGDEFRRTLVRPKPGPAPASNQNLKFVRGDRTLGADFWYNSHYYHQLSRSVGATNITGSTTLEIRNAAYPPKSGMRFVFGSTGGVENVYRLGTARNIVYKEPDPLLNIAPGTYRMDIVDENGDPKPLASSIPDGTTIEFLLDNEHCDMLLVSDAMQLRNFTSLGCKGYTMAFDPAGQILTRSPYGQVCATFSGEGGGGQFIDGMSGNQVCYVYDTSYTDPFTGTQGSIGVKMTVTGLVRRPEIPNTFYIAKKKYVIIDSTTPDVNGTAILTLSAATPIEIDDTYLPAGFIPNNTQILIETAGNRSMLSNDFTMVNDLGYGIFVENNGVCEAVSQFTYYCRVGYLAKSGGQIRSVGGSSCYGLIGLQSEGNDPNEAIQIGRVKTTPVNIITPYIDNPLADGNIGAVSFIVGGVDSKPLRNSTFKLDKHEIVIKNIARARLPGGTLTTGPLVVTTNYKHPFVSGDSVQLSAIRGVELKPLTPGGANRTTDLDNKVFTITVTGDYSFTLNTSDSLLYANDLGTYQLSDPLPLAISNLVTNASNAEYTVKGDPSPRNIFGSARFDGTAGENTQSTSTLKVFNLSRPAVVNMKFTLQATNPRVLDKDTVYKVTAATEKLVTFKASPRLNQIDNKVGDTTLYIAEVQANGDAFITSSSSSYAPKAGWTFQLLDTNLGVLIDYQRYTVTGTPTYDAGTSRWALTLDKPLNWQMVNQVATAQKTKVSGFWDLTLDRPLAANIPNTATPVSFIFYDSYWNVSIDPSLTVQLPTTVDSYNKPQAKRFNLYQLKTISVSQIINKPPIVNSSAVRFSTNNFDTSIYRILGKTSDGGITVDTYQLKTTAEPLTGFNVNAVAKLTANKEFIQNEVTSYLATIYPDFVYNVTTCARDVGFIIDAVIYDLSYGGNVRSRGAAASYYQQGNPSAALVLSNQKPETIDAINYATIVAQYVVNQYIGAVTPQLSLPYRGSNLNGVAQLAANRLFIQNDVIAFLDNTYPGFNYDQDKCRRDVGLIVSAVLDDIILGTNFKSRIAGLAYIRSYASSVTTLQKSQTVAGINKAKDLCLALISDPVIQSSITTNFNIVTTIINAVNASAAPTIIFTNPVVSDVGYTNSVSILKANRSFFQAEVVAWVTDNLVGYTYGPAVQTKCERDITYILDSARYDLVFGTNFNAVRTGLAYARASATYLKNNQNVQTIQGIIKAKEQAQALVSANPVALSRVTSTFDQVLSILQGGTASTLTFPTPSGASQDKINAKDQLLQNRTFIQSEIVAFVNANNPPANYDSAKCARDVGYLVDALCYDIVYGGNSASHFAAESYFVGTTSQLAAGQATATATAYSRLQVVVGQIAQGTTVVRSAGNGSTQLRTGLFGTSTEATALSTLVAITKDVITAGNLNTMPAIVYPVITLTDAGLQTAANAIATNTASIRNYVSTYIISSFTGYEYDLVSCARDTGYIVDALCYDLLYGGNSQIIETGNAYYFGTVSPTQLEPTVLVYTYFKGVIQSTLQNITITKTTGNNVTQDVSLALGSSGARNYTNALMLNIITIIKDGVAAGPTLVNPTFSNGINYATANDEKTTILDNIETVKNGVISYLNTTFSSGFTYNQTKCRRDVGYIIDAIAYDLEYGGNVKSRAAAIQYYDGTYGRYSVEKTQTIAAMNHIRSIVPLIVLEQTVTRQTGNVSIQNTAGTPGTTGVDNTKLQLLLDIIINVFTNGVTAAPARDLGIARIYQNPSDATYVPQNINNSLVSESNVGTRISSLMNQITAIINLGTTGTHVIPEQQIKDTLQSLEFPAIASSLQYGGVLIGTGIPTKGVNGVTEDTIIRTVTQLFDENQNVVGYKVKISALVTQTIAAGTEITVTGPGSDYLFDLNTKLDSRHLAGDVIGITTTFSTVRATGHDFLQVGSGGFDDSNYPNNVYGPPVNTPSSGAIVKEVGTGRVFHVSTDQDGNFRVGSYFNVNQGDGSVTIAAKIGLSAVSSLTFLTGQTVRSFSDDTKMDENSDNVVPTQKAVKTYINSIISGRFTVDNSEATSKGLLTLDGANPMKGTLNLGFHKVENVINSTEIEGFGLVNRKYVDNAFAGGTIDYDGVNPIVTTGKRTEVNAFEMLYDITSTGGVALNRGGIDLNNNKILRVKTPTLPGDAASKVYVDQALATGGVRTAWQGFTLSDTVARYYVSSVNTLTSGAGYTVPPVVVFYSTTGTGAVGRAVLESGTGPRGVQLITVDVGGYNYQSAPSIIIGGSIASVAVNNEGQNYLGIPTLTFSSPQLVGGITATGYVVMTGSIAANTYRVASVVITNAGAGYTITPTITQTHPNGAPALAASLLASLQGGNGANASAIMTATQKDINLNGNKVTGSADPVNPTDTVTLNYFDNKNHIKDIADVTISGTPGSGDLLVFTGETPAGSGGSMVNAALSNTSDVTLTRAGNTITIALKDLSLTNAKISASAGILQSKLAMNKANTVLPTSSAGASDFGVAAFNQDQFSSTSGFISIRQSTKKTDGVLLDRIQQITNKRILGRYAPSEGDTVVGAVQELTDTDIKNLIGLAPGSVSGLISDDVLGGTYGDGSNVPLSARDVGKSGGAQSFGALLRTGGTMRGKITFSSTGLPASDPAITPIMAIASGDNEKFDIGTGTTSRFRTINAKAFSGDTFITTVSTGVGGTFGASTEPTTINTGATFNGTATFAKTGGALAFALGGTTAGAGDISIKAGGAEVTFNGTQAATISVLADTAASASTIVRRDSSKNINATTFTGALSGNATTASGLLLSGTTYSPTSVNNATGVPLIISGEIKAVTFSGTATYANYKDLAENYVADKQYEAGTVVEFGGEFEITLAEDETRRVAGVISTDPAYWMGKDMKGEFVLPVALQGRVPCKVRGKIRKGDLMVSAGGGYARPTNDPKIGTIIGKALENFDGIEGVIEVVVGRV